MSYVDISAHPSGLEDSTQILMKQYYLLYFFQQCFQYLHCYGNSFCEWVKLSFAFLENLEISAGTLLVSEAQDCESLIITNSK
jgi:hypothetical protein